MDVIHVNHENRDTYHSIAEPSVMALGFFDGVHVGHQEVINTAKKLATKKQLHLACMSFYPHPKEVLTNKSVDYLMPMSEKQKCLRKMGINTFYIVEFDPTFASLSPKQFVRNYLLDFNVKEVVAGFDFTYGCRGEGNLDQMKSDSDRQLEVTKVEKVEYGGEKISSTLIRKLIGSGDVEMVHRYLGERYQIKGNLRRHEDRAELVASPHYVMPAPGVYEVYVSVTDKSWKQNVVVTGGCIYLNDIPLFADNYEVEVEWIKCLRSTLDHQFLQNLNFSIQKRSI